MLGLELKKPLKRLAARFFQLSLPPLLVPPLLPLGREQLEGVGGSCPGMLASPRNSDMFFRRRPGAWSGKGDQGQPFTNFHIPTHKGFQDLRPAWDVGRSLYSCSEVPPLLTPRCALRGWLVQTQSPGHYCPSHPARRWEETQLQTQSEAPTSMASNGFQDSLLNTNTFSLSLLSLTHTYTHTLQPPEH